MSAYAQRRHVRSLRLAAVPLAPLLALALALALVPSAAVRADGGAPNLAYVVGGGSGGGDLTVIDIAKRKVTGHVTIGGDPASVLLSADGRYAYIPQTAKNQVAIVDTRSLSVTATMAAGPGPKSVVIGFTANAPLLYVADSGGNTVTVLNPDTRRAVATIPVGVQPSGLAIAGLGSGIRETNPNDAEIYVANTGSDTVSVISTERRAVIATIPAPGGPVGVVIPSAGGVAYVSTRTGTVLGISIIDHTLLGTLLQLHGQPGQMDYDAITGEVYVPDPAAGVVDVLAPVAAGDPGQPATLPPQPERTMAFAGGPAAVAITFDGALGFVAEHDTGQVVMFDVAAHHTLATISVSGHPRAVITGAYPPILSQQTASIVGVLLYVAIGVVLLAVIVFYLRYAQRIQRTQQARSGASTTAKARHDTDGSDGKGTEG